MKKILLIIVFLLFVIGLFGCENSEVPIKTDEPLTTDISEDTEVEDVVLEKPSTMTCSFDDNIIVYTYDDDEIFSVVKNSEEIETGLHWTTIIDNSYDGNVSAFITEMQEWYLNEDIYTDSWCEFK